MQEFGPALREWRQIRRLSQMDLGLAAGVSPRHISFLETGRSRPSRGMLLRLCDELEVPRGARNGLLTAAGMAPAYGSRDGNEAEIAPVREAVDWMLARHAPYPAFAVDRHWHLQALNGPATLLFGSTGLTVGDSLIEALTSNEVLRKAIENLDEVLRLSLARLRTELAHFGRDPVLEKAVAELSAVVPAESGPDGMLPAVIPARYRVGELMLSFFTTITQFGTAEDVALSELRIEMMFPADASTRAALEAMAQP